jgi:hypothetical protein
MVPLEMRMFWVHLEFVYTGERILFWLEFVKPYLIMPPNLFPSWVERCCIFYLTRVIHQDVHIGSGQRLPCSTFLQNFDKSLIALTVNSLEVEVDEIA